MRYEYVTHEYVDRRSGSLDVFITVLGFSRRWYWPWSEHVSEYRYFKRQHSGVWRSLEDPGHMASSQMHCRLEGMIEIAEAEEQRTAALLDEPRPAPLKLVKR